MSLPRVLITGDETTYRCHKHGEGKPLVYRKKSGHIGRACRVCRQEWRGRTLEHARMKMLAWRQKNRAYDNASKVRRREEHKALVLAEYGAACVCCGETEPAFLSIDHINRDGGGRKRKHGSSTIYAWLVKNDFPKDRFRLLCLNCNIGRERNGGVCPHEYGPRLVECRDVL